MSLDLSRYVSYNSVLYRLMIIQRAMTGSLPDTSGEEHTKVDPQKLKRIVPPSPQCGGRNGVIGINAFVELASYPSMFFRLRICTV
jgi:hypothetical protein